MLNAREKRNNDRWPGLLELSTHLLPDQWNRTNNGEWRHLTKWPAAENGISEIFLQSKQIKDKENSPLRNSQVRYLDRERGEKPMAVETLSFGLGPLGYKWLPKFRIQFPPNNDKSGQQPSCTRDCLSSSSHSPNRKHCKMMGLHSIADRDFWIRDFDTNEQSLCHFFKRPFPNSAQSHFQSGSEFEISLIRSTFNVEWKRIFLTKTSSFGLK